METVVTTPPKKKRVSSSKRAGLLFPVSRVHRYLKQKKCADRVGPAAAVYLTAILEYLAAELLEISGNCAIENKRAIISQRHLSLAVRNDAELAQLLNQATIAGGGVQPNNIHPFLRGKKKSNKPTQRKRAAPPSTSQKRQGKKQKKTNPTLVPTLVETTTSIPETTEPTPEPALEAAPIPPVGTSVTQ